MTSRMAAASAASRWRPVHGLHDEVPEIPFEAAAPDRCPAGPDQLELVAGALDDIRSGLGG
jgi:hypothetical protein